MKKYTVKSIFGPTLQGEGSASGAVVIFLRFAGCNKWTGLEKDKPKSICSFCDTDFRGGDRLTAYEIVDRLKLKGSDNPGSPCKRVVISGGEPTLQLDKPLLETLVENGFILHLETNGSRALKDLLKYFYHITCSPKQPLNETKLEHATDLKILNPQIHKGISLKAFETFEATHRYLQPVWNEDYKDNLSKTVKEILSEPTWRLSLQTHKIIGVD